MLPKRFLHNLFSHELLLMTYDFPITLKIWWFTWKNFLYSTFNWTSLVTSNDLYPQLYRSCNKEKRVPLGRTGPPRLGCWFYPSVYPLNQQVTPLALLSVHDSVRCGAKSVSINVIFRRLILQNVRIFDGRLPETIADFGAGGMQLLEQNSDQTNKPKRPSKYLKFAFSQSVYWNCFY